MNEKKLFEYIRSADYSDIPSLKEILSSVNTAKIGIEDLLLKIKNESGILIIDARSEKEFEESALPRAINFPVLNDEERHDTGLIYKKYSRTAAVFLAMKYADPKSTGLKKFLEEQDAAAKNIIVYCWRGGGRSGYLAKMISDLGYSPVTLTGGQRSYRTLVNNFFSQKIFPFDLLELSGLTGSGKTELLRYALSEIPAIDLEAAAKHYSSLLGSIPYEIKNIRPVKNQKAFENNIFSGLIDSHPLYLIESESKKVGNFQIPENLYKKMINSKSVKIISSFEKRIQRIVKDYFGEDNINTEPMIRKMKEKESFFRQQLSNSVYDNAVELLDKGDTSGFTEIMIKDYYDKKYKDKGKKYLAEISADDIDNARKELIGIYNSLKVSTD